MDYMYSKLNQSILQLFSCVSAWYYAIHFKIITILEWQYKDTCLQKFLYFVVQNSKQNGPKSALHPIQPHKIVQVPYSGGCFNTQILFTSVELKYMIKRCPEKKWRKLGKNGCKSFDLLYFLYSFTGRMCRYRFLASTMQYIVQQFWYFLKKKKRKAVWELLTYWKIVLQGLNCQPQTFL